MDNMWKRAQKYHLQLQNNDNLQYDIAMNYYENLKQRMIKEIDLYNRLNERKYLSEKLVEITAEQLLNEVVNTKIENTDTEKSEAQGIMNAVTDAVSLFVGDPKQGTGLSQQRRKTAKQYLKQLMLKEIGGENNPTYINPENYKDKSGYNRAFTQRFRRDMDASRSTVLSELDQLVTERLNSLAIQHPVLNETKVRSAFKTYSTRLFAQKITDKKMFASLSQTPYINLIKGLAREGAVANGINKFLQKVEHRSQQSHKNNKFLIEVGADSDSSGKESKIDLLINTIMDEKAVKEIFKQDYLGVAEIDSDIFKQYMTVNNGHKPGVYGAQVKSFKLSTASNFIDGLGSSATLRNKLLQDKKYGNGLYLAGNVVFMGQATNIKEALGTRNVMYVDGEHIFWMPDFIQAFREKHFYLMLQTDSKYNYQASSEIALYNYAASKRHYGLGY